MSVEAMAIALRHSRADKASTRMILLGIANHDGDGGAWPSVSTLADYAAVQERAVQKALSELIDLGEIEREIQRGGTLEMAPADRPNLYHFLLKCPPHCDGSRSHKLICQGCYSKTKPLRNTVANQTNQFHPGCKEGVSHRTPGVPQDTRGVSPRTPKPSHELPNHVDKETYVPNRTREAAPEQNSESAAGASSLPLAAADATSAPSLEGLKPCPRQKFLPHAFANGACVTCGAPETEQGESK